MRRTLLLFTLLLSALATFAQQPSFYIERVEIRGTRFTSANVVKRQTLLRDGETYSEAQIKAAVDRVNRLPFVIDAEPSLEKGSEREHYVLTIRITETKPLFVQAESHRVHAYGAPHAWFEQHSIESGVRGFLGSTLLHASTDFKGIYHFGVTQYDLFGSPAFASLNVSWTDRRHFGHFTNPFTGEAFSINSKSSPSTELLLGMPVTANNTLQVSWTHNAFSQSITTAAGITTDEHSRSDYGTAAWIYDSTDDALFPTRGNFARGGLYLTEARTLRMPADPVLISAEYHQQTAFAEAKHYWDFGSVGSVNAGVNAARSRTPFPRVLTQQPPQYTDTYGATAGYSVSLWPRRQTRRIGDLRLQLQANYAKSDAYYSPAYYSLQGGIAFRNPWALLRLTAEYNRQGNR